MQNNPNNPYDEVFSNLARIVEDLVKNLPENQQARVIGYTIITRHTDGGDPEIFRLRPEDDDREVPYEVVEGSDEIYITALLPADTRHAPVADIGPDRVRICIDDQVTTIMLPHPVDRIHSTYRVHRGVMDITLRKVRIG